RPKISLPPPAPAREHVPTPVSRQPEPAAPLPAPRIVEAPSADLVQTLLSRALYASPEPVLPMENGGTNGHVATFTDGNDNFALEFLSDGAAPARKRRSPKLRKFLLWETIAI